MQDINKEIEQREKKVYAIKGQLESIQAQLTKNGEEMMAFRLVCPPPYDEQKHADLLALANAQRDLLLEYEKLGEVYEAEKKIFFDLQEQRIEILKQRIAQQN